MNDVTRTAGLTAVLLGIVSALWGQSPDTARYEKVRALNPLGYWPADEGSGTVLHERSGNGASGTVYHVPWEGRLLNFTSDTYQWVQLPNGLATSDTSFSIGGWVLTRRAYPASGTLFMGQHFRKTSPDASPQWGGWGGPGTDTNGVMLIIGGTHNGADSTRLHIASGGGPQPVVTEGETVDLPVGRWQHVLYTFGEGTGTLYLNGSQRATAADLPFEPTALPFVVGSDVQAWAVWPPGRRSLDGSVRDLVLFNRVLTAAEVQQLHVITQPERLPVKADDDHLIVDGRTVSLSDLQSASGLQGQALPLLTDVVSDATKPLDVRAGAALALAEMRGTAANAVPALLTLLDAIVTQEGTHLPKVEDLLRNAVMKALLDIAPQDPRVRTMMGKALATPLLQSLDLSQPYLDGVRKLLQEDQPMEALDLHRKHLEALPELPGRIHWGYASPSRVQEHLPLRPEYHDAFLSKGNPFSDAPYRPPGCKPADYTPIDVHEGVTYMTVVERVPLEEVQTIYERHLASLAPKPPSHDAVWSRVKIVSIDSQGTTREAVLLGDWFLFDASDAKMDGWGLGVDRDGRIHLVGGQHNQPNPKNFIPGSWEKMGLSGPDARPRVMAWVSEQPGRIDAFTFVGQRDDPRSIPCGWMNYMNFVRSPDGTLFLYGRDHIWTWGLYRYDADAQRWANLGKSPAPMFQKARKTNPEWTRYTDPVQPTYGPTPSKVLVCAWQPGAYNFCRSRWGIRFDRSGRMHLNLGIHGVGEDARLVNGPVYAYSDDHGDTFHRADGTPLALPLTVNPIPGHHADIHHHRTQQWLDTWLDLLRHAGYSPP